MRLRRRAEGEELSRVYREHVDAVFGFFSYSVGRERAEDLTGETFERIVRAYGRYDARRASERTWILSIARNLLADHFRREQHRRARSTDAEPELLEKIAVTDVLDRILDADELRALVSVLGQRERDVVALRYGADLPGTEVAEMLGLSVANVHQIASRSLAQLRQVLDEAQREEQRSTNRSTSR